MTAPGTATADALTLTEEEQMEKLGVAKKDLIAELEGKYHDLKEKEASLVKVGHSTQTVQSELEQVKAKIDEVRKD